MKELKEEKSIVDYLMPEYNTDTRNRAIFWSLFLISIFWGWAVLLSCVAYYYGFHKPVKEGKLDKNKRILPLVAIIARIAIIFIIFLI